MLSNLTSKKKGKIPPFFAQILITVLSISTTKLKSLGVLEITNSNV